VLASPFDALVDHLDMVSYVRDYVELRINYSIVRLLTGSDRGRPSPSTTRR